MLYYSSWLRKQTKYTHKTPHHSQMGQRLENLLFATQIDTRHNLSNLRGILYSIYIQQRAITRTMHTLAFWRRLTSYFIYAQKWCSSFFSHTYRTRHRCERAARPNGTRNLKVSRRLHLIVKTPRNPRVAHQAHARIFRWYGGGGWWNWVLLLTRRAPKKGNSIKSLATCSTLAMVSIYKYIYIYICMRMDI